MQVRHDIQGHDEDRSTQSQGIVSKWRQKERLKTTAVALVLCLNIGVDPPDVIKISPCARLECWVDPLSMQPPKALDTIGTALSHARFLIPFCPLDIICMHIITVASKPHVHAGKNLQAQYERWQPRAKYKMHLDPTMDDVKKLAVSSRRAAKVSTLSLHHCRTQALPTAHSTHASALIQPGHAAVADQHILQPICQLTQLHPYWVCLCTNAGPACIWIVITALSPGHCRCFHTSCMEHCPPGSHDDASA